MNNLQNQIKIRNNGLIKEIKIPKENLEKLTKVLNGNFTDAYRKKMMYALTGTQGCTFCDGIPECEIKYEVGDQNQAMTKVERYCSLCLKKVYSRE